MEGKRVHFIVVFLICLALVLGGCRTTPRLEVTVEVATKAVPTATATAITVEPTKIPGPTLLNPSNTAVGPRKRDPMSVATDDEGNVHVAWYVEPLAESRILYQKWAGESSFDSIEIGAGRYPVVAASDGHVYVLGDVAAGSGKDFVYRHSADGGDSWSELKTVPIADLSSENAEHAILIDSAGHLHMAWSRFSGPSRSDLFYSHWDGDSWAEPVLISDGRDYANRPSLATTQAGGIHFVWLSSTGGRYDIYHRYWDGESWSSTTRVSEGGWNVDYHTLSVDEEGHLHLAWHEFHGPVNSEVYHSWWDGKIWSRPVNVSNDEETSKDPLLVIDENVHLVWLQPGGREGTIRYSQWDASQIQSSKSKAQSGAWSEPEIIVPPAFILNVDDAAIVQEGDLYLLWRVGGESRDVQIYHYGRWDGASPVTPHVLGGIGQWAYLGLVTDSRGNVYSAGLNVGFNRPEVSRLQE
ncbi:MAG: exo-alpha-sialidase [Chloroflexi bacterium]|nr:exo-alpha-sialidase [Chloroflexota bacterium]